MHLYIVLLCVALNVTVSFYVARQFASLRQISPVFGRRKPFRQNYPRKMKRILRSSNDTASFSRVLNSVFENYLKYNASEGMHEAIMKKIGKRARQLNITMNPDFAKRANKVLRPTMMEWLTANGSFTTFVNAVNQLELPEFQVRNLTIRYTILVPTDAAFSAVKNETLAPILADPDKLRQLLHHHMALNLTTTKKLLTAGKFITFLEGKTIFSKIDKRDGSQMIGNAKCVMGNVRCRDGLMHAIDTVQIPR